MFQQHNSHITRIILLLFALSHSLGAFSQVNLDSSVVLSSHLTPRELNICEDNDSLSTRFKSQQLIVPGILMFSGLVCAIDYENSLNRSVNDAMTNLSKGKTCKIDDYLRFVPSATHLLLGSVGIKSKHNFKERFLISATSHAAMLIIFRAVMLRWHSQVPSYFDKNTEQPMA